MALVKAQEEKCSEALNHMQDAMLEREMAGLAIDSALEHELKKHQAHVAKHNKRPGGVSALTTRGVSSMMLIHRRRSLTKAAARSAAPSSKNKRTRSRLLFMAGSLRALSAGMTCIAS